MKENAFIRNLTRGSVARQLILFAVPIILSNLMIFKAVYAANSYFSNLNKNVWSMGLQVCPDSQQSALVRY